MSDLRITDSFKTIILTSGSPMRTTDDMVRDFMVRLESLNRTVTLASLTLTPDLSDPKKFNYKFVTKDARQWVQKILITDGDDEARMTYNVPDMFKPSEVNANITLRNNSMVPLIKAGVTKITSTWI